jgi:hypothetical protein
MLYEWRVYEVVPGRMSALHNRFRNITLGLFQKHGIRVVGFWEAVIGASNTLYYMLAWENMAERERVWNSFQSDPEWTKARQESEKEGPIVQKVVNMLLSPTPYSAMR